MSSHAPTRPVPLFDALYRECGYRSDYELARAIETHKCTISHIRHGRLEISDQFVCKVARATGWTVKRIDDLVMWGQV
jgi:plasmid maintenance system antidote protein VapI